MKAAYQQARKSPAALKTATDQALMRLNAGDMGAPEAMHIIKIFQLAGNPAKCMEAIKQLEQRRIKVGSQHYNAAISAHSKRKLWKEMWSLFEEMGLKRIARDVVTYSTVISASGKQGRWKEALRLFDEMEQKGVERNTITYSAAISACEKGGQWEHALRLFDEMEPKGVERDTITYNAAISACEKGGQWEHALRLFDEMERKGVERDTITYSAAISACEHNCRFAEAALLYRRALQGGFFSACAQHGGLLQLDLHHLPCSVSRVAIAHVLDQMLAGAIPIQGIAIITGQFPLTHSVSYTRSKRTSKPASQCCTKRIHKQCCFFAITHALSRCMHTSALAPAINPVMNPALPSRDAVPQVTLTRTRKPGANPVQSRRFRCKASGSANMV